MFIQTSIASTCLEQINEEIQSLENLKMSAWDWAYPYGQYDNDGISPLTSGTTALEYGYFGLTGLNPHSYAAGLSSTGVHLTLNYQERVGDKKSRIKLYEKDREVFKGIIAGDQLLELAHENALDRFDGVVKKELKLKIKLLEDGIITGGELDDYRDDIAKKKDLLTRDYFQDEVIKSNKRGNECNLYMITNRIVKKVLR